MTTGDVAELLPVRRRITEVPDARQPAPFDGVTYRPCTLDDVDALLEVSRAIGALEHPDYAISRDELVDELSHSWVDPERDTVLAFAGERLVGFANSTLSPSRESIVRAITGGGTHPEWQGRGLGTLLMAWARDRALQQLATADERLPAWVMSYADDRAPQRQALARDAGFTAARWFHTLERDVTTELPPASPPDGLRFVAFADADGEAVRVAKNDMFRDHWGSQPTTVEQWASFTGQRIMRPDLGVIALDGAVVVGLVLAEVNEEEWVLRGRPVGYVPLVGTARTHRGRGVAAALLGAVLANFREAGVELVDLDVDADSPTGAVGVYERVGFRRTQGSTAFTIEV